MTRSSSRKTRRQHTKGMLGLYDSDSSYKTQGRGVGKSRRQTYVNGYRHDRGESSLARGRVRGSRQARRTESHGLLGRFF